ncbi:hypothetical protein MTR_0168s0100 [Medicago truncatula]|uniref:Uncharacterized protein n=1 Tax=Medicago truncatula TaxID=3880 RepID=A0A072TGK2_MEDTR|nr:hypothetical protein MTR_0168s0100 [Medicago truncatula]
MARFRVVSFDKEIVKFVKQGGSKENMGLRFMELGCEVKGLGPGDVSIQQQQQPSLIPLSGVGYMDQMTP